MSWRDLTHAPRMRTAAVKGTRAAAMIRLAVYIDRGQAAGLTLHDLAEVMGMSTATLVQVNIVKYSRS